MISILISIFILCKNTLLVRLLICTSSIIYINSKYGLLCSLLYLLYFPEELSWKSNVSCLATCPIKKEGLSGRESLKLLA